MIPERTIDFVFFDLGNVLLNFCHKRACEQVACAAGLSSQAVWKAVFETAMVGDYELGRITDQEFHAQFCAVTKAKVELPVFLRAFSDIFSLNQPVIPLVVELTQRNFPIGILSNTCNAHWQFAMDQFPLLSAYFGENCVLSFRESSAKPERQIYEAAIQLAHEAVARNGLGGISPSRVFFVDDREENVVGACHVGLDAVRFESADQLRQALHQRGLQV
jgi:putative hydrolase of the HAD superfamily